MLRRSTLGVEHAAASGTAEEAGKELQMQFELRRAHGAQPWYWLIRASNGKVLATSETYYNREDAVNAADSVRRNAATAPFYDMTKAA